MNVISFSGGKDSTAMLLMMIEKGISVDKIINIDTTKEFPQMYEHIKRVQTAISVEITTIKIDFDYYFSEHVKTKGKNKGERGYGWCGPLSRWCTRLKLEALKKEIHPGDIEFIGISYDEQYRLIRKNNKRFQVPLVDWEITGKKALEYCYEHGFDWDGLYKKMERVSCWCCPLSQIKSLRSLYNDFPKLWKKLEEMDARAYNSFKPKWSVDQLATRFRKEREIAINAGFQIRF